MDIIKLWVVISFGIGVLTQIVIAKRLLTRGIKFITRSERRN